MSKSFTSFLLLFAVIAVCSISSAIIFPGCAQIGMPTGGAKDSIPPRLLSSSPRINSIGVTGNKITLSFDEYIEVKDAQANVLVSPFQKNVPSVDYKLRTVTVKLKDTLLPNTTYSINFGKAIVDLNEGNPLKDLTFVFSTGNTIDSLMLDGKVLLAETGKADSTIIAMLYRNADDSAVKKRRPDYISRLDGSGNFSFRNLPAGKFKLYALLDGDGGKTYNSRFETFAFGSDEIVIGANNPLQVLFAYAEEKEVKNTAATARATAADKKLKYSTSVTTGAQELTDGLLISYNRPLKEFDPAKIRLTDSNYNTINVTSIALDSTKKNVSIQNAWQEEFQYRLIISQDAAKDSAGNMIAKADTIKFNSKTSEDYGRVVLRFNNLDLSKHPVLQLVQNNEVKNSYRLTAKEWSNKLVGPGEYELRILYDENSNGKWDPGNYSQKKQPEKVLALPQKLGVRANWDNERDVNL